MCKKTGRPAASKFKSTGIKIQLSAIKAIHPNISFADLTANLEYILSDIELVCKDVVKKLLLLHPIIVVKSSNNSAYYCIGGFRSLQISRSLLKQDDEVTVNLLIDANEHDVAYIANTDVYLSHLLYSLKTSDADKQLKSLFQEIDQNYRQRLTPDLNKNKFANLISKNRIFTRQRKKK